MAFTCTIEANKLQRALMLVKPFAPKNNTIPVLGCIRIISEDNSLRLVATDLDVWVSHVIPDVLFTGSLDTCIPAGALCNFVSTLDGAVYIHRSDASDVDFDAKVFVDGEGSSCGFTPTCDGEDFPGLPGQTLNLTDGFTIPPFFIASVLERVAPYISTEETRYYLNGIYLHNNDGFVRAIATDGHRMGWIDTYIPAAENMGIIVPSELVRRLKDLAQVCWNADFRFNQGHNLCRVQFGSTTIVSTLIDGTFPDYKRVIPKLQTVDVRVKTRQLRQAIAKLTKCVWAGEKTPVVRLEKSPSKVVLRYKDHSGVVISQEVGAVGDPWPGIAAFNLRYFSGLIKNQAGLNTIIKLPVDEDYKGFCHAGIIKSDNDPLNSLLMPMKA